MRMKFISQLMGNSTSKPTIWAMESTPIGQPLWKHHEIVNHQQPNYLLKLKKELEKILREPLEWFKSDLQ